jgi:hypothetical protein
MKTNLDREIKSEHDAVQFITELCKNGEAYHPEDDARHVIWQTIPEEDIPTREECHKLNELMDQIYSRTEVDPCEIILTYINTQ